MHKYHLYAGCWSIHHEPALARCTKSRHFVYYTTHYSREAPISCALAPAWTSSFSCCFCLLGRLRAPQKSSKSIFSEASASRDPSKRRISNQTRTRCDVSTPLLQPNQEAERNTRANRKAWDKSDKKIIGYQEQKELARERE